MAIKNELGFETLKKQLLEIERKNIKEIDKDESQPVIDTKSKEKKEKAKEIPIEGFNVPNKVLNKVGINLEILNQYLMQTFGETDKLLNEKLIKSFDILESREILKQKLKIDFFYIIMGLLIILTISPLIIVFVFCNNSNSYAFALSTIASVVELATGIIILPKIIARYLFNREEDNLYFELIRDLKDYHNSKRKDFLVRGHIIRYVFLYWTYR